jgi:hypothetical protein
VPVDSLVAALSQAFVAFTIEADNEFESRMPHRTAADRGDSSKSGPWLTSLTFWSNYLRHIPDDGCTARELAHGAGDGASTIASRLGELRRWGYVRVHAADGDQGERLITLTANGARARDTWAPIEALVEDRWQTRFGGGALDALRAGLETLPVPTGLPLGFPILAWGRVHEMHATAAVPQPGLSTLLARAILAMAMEFDHDAPISLATALDLTRLLERPSRVSDLPLRAGVSREAIAIGVGGLARSGLARVSGSPKSVALTTRGHAAARASLEQCSAVEDRWDASTSLGDTLGSIVGSTLAAGLVPPEGGWRSRPPYLAQTRAILADPVAALPHFPMVSHRGGYPDGS